MEKKPIRPVGRLDRPVGLGSGWPQWDHSATVPAEPVHATPSRPSVLDGRPLRRPLPLGKVPENARKRQAWAGRGGGVGDGGGGRRPRGFDRATVMPTHLNNV